MNKFWRRLHFLSTVVAGLFIFFASVTGCILAVEPWLLSQNAVSGQHTSDLTLKAFQEKLGAEFLEVFSFEKDAYGNIKVEGIGNEKEGTLFVNAETGKVLDAPKKLSTIFDLSRDLHRSLFLKTPGRIIVGLASLALVFLVVSGIGLHIKRAGGLKAIYKSIKILEIKRDGHAQLSRLFVIPILIIAVSGTYLSVIRFAPKAANETITAKGNEFSLNKILMSEVKKVTLPVVEEDPLTIELADKVLHYDKATEKLIKIEVVPISEQMRALDFSLHTGEGLKSWAVVLFLTSLVMVFLSFTGFQMVGQKWKQKKHKAIVSDDVDTIILVGSETGHTWRFADALEEAYQKLNIKVSAVGLENFPKISGKKTLLILTSTYGDGDAPENAQDVLAQLDSKISGAELVQYSVLGFGSKEYPAFCAFAEELRNELAGFKHTQEITPYMTVDNQSVVQFIDWVRALNKIQKINLNINPTKLHPVRKKGLDTFKILEKKEQGDTFLLRIGHSDKLKIQSGDLLGVYPPDENIERYYSIASIGPTELILLIKRTGLCSNFLGNLPLGHTFEAYLKRNPTFYFPADNSPVLMIANGTGVAPFLGMQSTRSTLYWGGKNRIDFELFTNYTGANNCHLVFSREETSAYVQDLLVKNETDVAHLLGNQGTIMICGSLTMLKGVLVHLDNVTTRHQLPSVDVLKKQGRILIDCY